jgi:hypothetical protein
MIAFVRAVRWRSPGALWALARSAREGIAAARLAPDDAIPWDEPKARDGIEVVFIPRPRSITQWLRAILDFPVASIKMIRDYGKLWWQDLNATGRDRD